MKQEKLQCGFVKVKKDKGMKRGLQVLLPISLLSFLLSYYFFYSYISCFIQAYKFLFLFSNTIMLLLAAGDAGLLCSSPTSGNNIYVEYVTDQVASQQQQLNLDELMEIEHDQEKNTHVCQPVNLVAVEGGGGEEEEAVLEVEELELLNIDDLNRRFEEFIEKEKKKWKLEALQLVMV